MADAKNPSAVALGKLGGAAKSDRKTAANRANAKRPRPKRAVIRAAGVPDVQPD